MNFEVSVPALSENMFIVEAKSGECFCTISSALSTLQKLVQENRSQ